LAVVGTVVPAEPGGPAVSSTLDVVAATVGWLPPITVVRTDNSAGEVAAHVLVANRRITVQRTAPRTRVRNEPGPKNAFNAGLINSLAHGDPRRDLESIAREAATAALDAWLDVRHSW
jgi:hypothetical protein